MVVSLSLVLAVSLWQLDPATAGGDAPSPTPLTTGARLAPAAVAPGGEGGHAFLTTGPDGVTPLRFDPCREIRWVVRPGGEPPGGRAVLAATIGELGRTTGLRFRSEGNTDEGPDASRPAVQQERYGDRWAPVLITWSDPVESPRLQGAVAAYAGPTSWGDVEAGTQRYVTGDVVIDTADFLELGTRPAGAARQQNLLLHELGHLVGLAHVEDPSQAMYAESVEGQFGYRDGDLRGLAALGTGPCFLDR